MMVLLLQNKVGQQKFGCILRYESDKLLLRINGLGHRELDPDARIERSSVDNQPQENNMPSQLSRSLIKNLDLFKAMPDAALDAALQSAQVCRLADGDAAFHQGEAATQFFVLLHGHLKEIGRAHV